jgi:FtsZ-interacting cell division protein ZipA
MKFFIYLGLIIIIILLVTSWARKKINRFVQSFIPNQNQDKKNKHDEVLYDKDNVVVMRGESKKGEEGTK